MNWYKKGLRFHCLQCGQCCSGFPGFVWLSSEDQNRIATFLNLSLEKFLQTYTRSVEGKISLLELSEPSYDCIFLKDKKCTIYPVRPTQCKTFPFWKHSFQDKKTWELSVQHCKGAHDKNAPIISQEEISQKLLT